MKRHAIWQQFKSFKFNSLLIRNFVLIFLVVVVPTLTITYTVQNRYNTVVEEEIQAAQYNSLLRMKETIDRAMKESTRLATYLSIAEDFELYFTSSPAFIIEHELLAELRKQTNSYLSIYEYIDSFYLSSLKFNDFFGDIEEDIDSIGMDQTTLDSITWFEEDKADKSVINRYFAWQDNRPNQPLSNYISIVHYVKDAMGNYRGSVTANLRSTYLSNMIDIDESLGEVSLALDNASGRIILSKGQKLFLEPLSDQGILKQAKVDQDGSEIITVEGKRYIAASVQSDYMEWTYMSMVPLLNYSNNVEAIIDYVQRQIMIFLIISLILSYLLTVKTYEPISEIMRIIENPGIWNRRKHSFAGEIDFISENILNVVLSNDTLEHELRQKMQLLDKAQNKALQSQMNPHFLYNTLEWINFEAMEIAGGQNNASAMISDLSEMLRYNLDAEQYGTVKSEVASVRLYLEIMNKRNQGKIGYEIDIEDSLMKQRMLKLSLQPLVENAIYHGIKPKRGNGVIRIKGWATDATMYIRVSDDGVGMSYEQLESLKTRIEDKYTLRGDGIGVYNVNQRMKILYGDTYGISLESQEGLGTTVTMRFPYEMD